MILLDSQAFAPGEVTAPICSKSNPSKQLGNSDYPCLEEFYSIQTIIEEANQGVRVKPQIILTLATIHMQSKSKGSFDRCIASHESREGWRIFKTKIRLE